ncbi:MAG: arsenate reductase ArsC [Blastomonas fulva]
MADPIYNVLFLCTGNSARSILGEAVLNKIGEGRFRAYSAGSHPKGQVHPMALSVLADMDFETSGFESKSWDAFGAPGSPEFDFIFTVCDNAAGETCPVWLGHPMTAHWGIEDPAAVEGDGQREAFLEALRYLSDRIEQFVALPIESLDQMTLKRKLADIGSAAGASSGAGA